MTMARGCDTVVVTVEKIVSNRFIRRHAEQNELPAYKTTLVVETPYGAHPTALLGRYSGDDAHVADYVAASRTEEGFAAYLDRYVFGPADHAASLETPGADRPGRLQRTDERRVGEAWVRTGITRGGP